jgi:poly-gamma-glutamate synthesis protein (capsule biosynthesis protein)
MKIALLGDIAFIGNASISSNSNFKEYFSEVAEYLKTMDRVVGNLETPFSVKKEPYGAKSAYICADCVDAELLSVLNVNAVSLANNHVFDYGVEGYELTKKILKSRHIDFFGTEGMSYEIVKDDNYISFRGFCCYSSNPLKTGKIGDYGVNEYDIDEVRCAINSDIARGFLPIVAVHSGKEHVNYPSKETVKAARQLTCVGKYIYYGHHPHVVQGVEERDGSLLMYSLGNFCFDDIYQNGSKDPFVELTDNNRTSVIAELEIKNNEIVNYRFVPIFIGKDKLHIGDERSNSRLKTYSESLTLVGTLEYDRLRNAGITSYYDERFSQRDIEWLIKRLRPRYIKLFFTNKINKWKYNIHVKNKII